MTSLVIRYSSMGDIVLTAGITKALSPVIFLTLERYAELAAALPGVIEVRTHEQHGRNAFSDVDQIIDELTKVKGLQPGHHSNLNEVEARYLIDTVRVEARASKLHM